MRKVLNSMLVALILAATVVTLIECPNCDHICDENCTYDQEGICEHECEYPIDPLNKWEPWG